MTKTFSENGTQEFAFPRNCSCGLTVAGTLDGGTLKVQVLNSGTPQDLESVTGASTLRLVNTGDEDRFLVTLEGAGGAPDLQVSLGPSM